MDYNLIAFRGSIHLHLEQEPSEVGEVHVQPTVEHPADARQLHAEEEEGPDVVAWDAKDHLEVST